MQHQITAFIFYFVKIPSENKKIKPNVKKKLIEYIYQANDSIEQTEKITKSEKLMASCIYILGAQCTDLKRAFEREAFLKEISQKTYILVNISGNLLPFFLEGSRICYTLYIEI